MSDQSGSNGNGDRATVALLNSKIDTVLATVQGQKETTDAHFDAIRAELKAMSNMSGRLDTLEQKNTALEQQVGELQRGRIYRSTVAPQVFLGAAMLIVAVVTLVIGAG